MAWLPGYGYRKPLVLTGGASGAQTDFQLNIDITHVAAKMQADFDDIRFAQNNGTTLIDAWLESKIDGTSAETWVEFPTTPANTVESDPWYMYYGKADAVSDWDGAATFPFFEDWGNLNAWTTQVGSPTVSGGELTLNNGGLSHTMTFPDSYCVRLKAKYNAAYAFMRFALLEDAWDMATETGPYIGWRTGNIEHYVGAWHDSGENYVTGVYDIIEMLNVDDTAYTFDVMVDDISGAANPAGFRNNKAMGMIGMWESDGADCVSDWILVRKYAANPPTYAFGAEESAPVGAIMNQFQRHNIGSDLYNGALSV